MVAEIKPGAIAGKYDSAVRAVGPGRGSEHNVVGGVDFSDSAGSSWDVDESGSIIVRGRDCR